jgi:predicted RNA-binding Zn-ribbon protein involved in translation (DUF1610 family)
MSDEPATSDESSPIEPGMVVYDDDGTALGVVEEFTSQGFEVDIGAEVETAEGEGPVDVSDPDVGGEAVQAVDEQEREAEEQEHIPGQEFGEGYIKWRCDDCGEMGDLDDGLPEECPNCGSEDVRGWRED